VAIARDNTFSPKKPKRDKEKKCWRTNQVRGREEEAKSQETSNRCGTEKEWRN